MMDIHFQGQPVHGLFKRLRIMVVMQGKLSQGPSVQLERRKILVLWDRILDLDSVSIQLRRQVFVQVVGQSLVHIVKNNNVAQIDVVLYQGVAHWHVLLERVREMLKIRGLVGLVLLRMEVLGGIGEI